MSRRQIEVIGNASSMDLRATPVITTTSAVQRSLRGHRVDEGPRCDALGFQGCPLTLRSSCVLINIPQRKPERRPAAGAAQRRRCSRTAAPGFVLKHAGGAKPCYAPQTQRFLLCLTVGIKQKNTVHAIVSKFDLAAFTVVLFHCALACMRDATSCTAEMPPLPDDGHVDGWSDLSWASNAIHVRVDASLVALQAQQICLTCTV